MTRASTPSTSKTKVEPGTCTIVQETGPGEIERIRIKPDESIVMGRSSSCDVSLEDPDASISRKHVQIEMIKDVWMITDLGSRNGTELNGTKLDADRPTPLKSGDLIGIGPWSFRVLGDPRTAAPVVQTAESSESTSQIERVQATPLAQLESKRLAALLSCADTVHSAESKEEAAMDALLALVEATGYTRGAYLIGDENDEDFRPVAFKSVIASESVRDLSFSRTLLRSAQGGEIVRLSGSNQQDYGQSISDLEIHSALCVPVNVSDEPVGYLYLDARGREGSVEHDSTSFAGAMSQLLGLAIANLDRKELEIQQHVLRYDLDAAANAQRLLLPPNTGAHGDIAYTMVMRPGRMVAGDLFGVVPLSDDRVCVFLGDVSGKGAGAAILMAATQSYLHAQLELNKDLGDMVSALNRHVMDRSTGQFITMWVGIIDPKNGTCSFVDCGHGHWLVVGPDGKAFHPEYRGGLVIGIDQDERYQDESVEFHPGSRVVLFSDGVVEQNHGDSEEQYGLDQAAELLSGCATHGEDVKVLLDDVLRFAESEELRDDTTIASIEYTRSGS